MPDCPSGVRLNGPACPMTLLPYPVSSLTQSLPRGRRHLSRRTSGFALIISLALMVFILMLMLSLSTLVQMGTLQGSVAAQQTEARQLALFSAMLALGELQQTAGPDQRVTARAGILDDTPETEAITGLDEPYWTGVWITDPDDADNGTGGDAHQNPAPIKNGLGNPGGALAWLVSTPGANPLNNTRSETDVPLLLVDASDPADPRNIYLPPQQIRDADGDISGKYAWWVADDGVKASLAMDNPWARSNESRDAAIAALAATRTAPELIEENDSLYDLSPLQDLGSIHTDASYTQLLERAGGLNQLLLLLQQAGLDSGEGQELIANHFHDLTSLSLGVLADVREGGLKRNLSAAFSNTDDFATLKSEHGNLVFGHRDQAEPYDPRDSDAARGASGSTNKRRDPGGPPWEQLRSFYRLRGDTVSVQPQTNTQMGVGPIVTVIQMHMHLLLLKAPGANQQYIARLMFFPAVVLWNPYNVALPSTDYNLFLTTNSNKIKYNWTPQVEWTDADGTTHTWAPGTIFEGADDSQNRGAFRFNISSAFGPGEAKLFLPGSVQPQNWASGNGSPLVDASAPGFVSGGYFYSELSDRFDPVAIAGVPPKTGLPFVLRLVSDSGTTGISYLHVGLGLDVGNGNLADMISQGPLQDISGFNQSNLGKTSGSSVLSPEWAVSPTAIPSFASDATTPWDALPLAALGGDNYFPILGFTQHFRWVQNLSPVTYPGSPSPTPIVSTLASYNPRAARSDRTPIEQTQDGDTRYNSLYLSWSGNRSDSMGSSQTTMRGSDSEDWGRFYSSLTYTQPTVGFTDDTNSSFITQDTLFDLPGGPEYFQSVGSLMHASLAPPMPRTNSVEDYLVAFSSSGSDWNLNSSYPAFAIGNSLAPLGVPLDERSRHTYKTAKYLSSDPGSLIYDWSYLLNDYLWDRYFFAEYDTNTGAMLNPRLVPLAGATAAQITSYEDAAAALMVNGAFNVNSTSVDAWRALLAGTVGATVNTTAYDTRAPYLQNLDPLLGDADTADEEDAQTYAGFRTLNAAEIDSLAQEIVKQVKKRGPFTSMAHFVNRVIDDADFLSSRENANLVLSADNRERAIGALQAALEASIVNDRYEDDSNSISYNELNMFDQFNRYTGMGSLSYGQPGYLTQGNLLSRLGAALSPRSDTFTIRAYGESVNPLTGSTEATARCELVVQRQPDELTPGSNNRRFVVVSFRWLDNHEI